MGPETIMILWQSDPVARGWDGEKKDFVFPQNGCEASLNVDI
jgi:hypothetical protein